MNVIHSYLTRIIMGIIQYCRTNAFNIHLKRGVFLLDKICTYEYILLGIYTVNHQIVIDVIFTNRKIISIIASIHIMI